MSGQSGQGKAPMAKPPDALREAAQASQRKLEWQAMDKAWEEQSKLLGLRLLDHFQRLRMKNLFVAGWQAASAYHTANLTKPRTRRSTTNPG